MYSGERLASQTPDERRMRRLPDGRCVSTIEIDVQPPSGRASFTCQANASDELAVRSIAGSTVV